MIYPEFIKEKDIIAVTAPSDGIIEKIDIIRLENAHKNFKERGFEVLETKNVRTSTKGKSTSSKKQAEELLELIKNKEVKVLFCAAGGDFLPEMLSFTNFSEIKNNPKWLQGYSDMTGLLFPITTGLDIATIYGSNYKAFGMKKWHKALEDNIDILKGNLIEQTSFSHYEKKHQEYKTGLEGYNLDTPVAWNILTGEEKIHVKGRLIGGCIDLLSDIFGTRFDHTKKFIEKYKDDGIIWYFDNADLTSEQLIRTLWKFKDSGWFKNTKCILFGRNINEKSYYEISFQEAIKSVLEELNIPIITDCCFGHTSPRMTLINGSLAEITVANKKGTITYNLI